MLRALIIEDETTARADLRAKLAAHPEVTITGEAATLREARVLLARDDYELVFLDVQLIGGTAFDLVRDVRAEARVVFATAFESYAVRAFEINALDYLLKPVEPARLAEALRRITATKSAEGADGSDGTDGADLPAGAALQPDDVLFLRSGGSARFTSVAEISVIAARGNYSEVVLADGAKVFLRKSMKAWEDTLPAPPFMRVHRTQIVNLARVRRYERDGEERTLLFAEGVREPVAASRYRWSELREKLHALRPAQ